MKMIPVREIPQSSKSSGIDQCLNLREFAEHDDSTKLNKPSESSKKKLNKQVAYPSSQELHEQSAAGTQFTIESHSIETKYFFEDG